MSYDFHVGQRVVCVDDRGHYGWWQPTVMTLGPLRRGVVYTIRRVGTYADEACLWLVEIIRPFDKSEIYGEPGYSPRRFRPLDERRLDIFRAHLSKAPTSKEPA